MRRTASEILSDLEIRIARLERQSFEIPPRTKMRHRKTGPMSLAEMNRNAQDLARSARMLGFKNAKVTFDDDNPVVDLKHRQLKIYVNPKAYYLIGFSSRTQEIYKYDAVKVILADKAEDLGLRSVRETGPLHEDAGTEEMGMEQAELTTEFNLVHDLLSNYGLFNERWTRQSNNIIVSGTGDYTLTLKQTPQNIKFTLTGPNLKRGEPISTIRGMVGGLNLHERFMNFAERMADIETAVTKRQSRLQAQALNALRASRR